jgi:hypothetical protein
MKKPEADEILRRLMADGETVTNTEMEGVARFHRQRIRSLVTQLEGVASQLEVFTTEYSDSVQIVEPDHFDGVESLIQQTKTMALFFPEFEPAWSDAETRLMAIHDVFRGVKR